MNSIPLNCLIAPARHTFALVAKKSSPFSLAQPTPALYAEAPCLASIKLSNGITLMALGQQLNII
jgi:hypothetical protein